MKAKFNFLQLANWLYICKNNIKSIISQELSTEEKIQRLKLEKRKLSILKDILNRKSTLHGISKDFISNLKQIKKEYGIEE